MPEPTRPNRPNRFPLGRSLYRSDDLRGTLYAAADAAGGWPDRFDRPGPRFARVLGRGTVPYPYPTGPSTLRATDAAAVYAVGPGRN